MAAIINPRKVAIVGCGFVGSASAFALMQSGLFSEMVLIDVDRDRAEGEALDIAHGMAFGSPMNIYAGDYSDIDDAAITVITAGANQEPGETRLEALRGAGATVESPGGGNGTCGICAVEIRRGQGVWERVLACQTPAEEGLAVRIPHAGDPQQIADAASLDPHTARF